MCARPSARIGKVEGINCWLLQLSPERARPSAGSAWPICKNCRDGCCILKPSVGIGALDAQELRTFAIFYRTKRISAGIGMHGNMVCYVLSLAPLVFLNFVKALSVNTLVFYHVLGEITWRGCLLLGGLTWAGGLSYVGRDYFLGITFLQNSKCAKRGLLAKCANVVFALTVSASMATTCIVCLRETNAYRNLHRQLELGNLH